VFCTVSVLSKNARPSRALLIEVTTPKKFAFFPLDPCGFARSG
jgi:hypothetical protein